MKQFLKETWAELVDFLHGVCIFGFVAGIVVVCFMVVVRFLQWLF